MTEEMFFVEIAEDVLALMIFTPVIFHGTINSDLYRNFVMMTKVYLTLIYKVDRVGLLLLSKFSIAISLVHLQDNVHLGVKRLGPWRKVSTLGWVGKM